jgi:hypothetical protein
LKERGVKLSNKRKSEIKTSQKSEKTRKKEKMTYPKKRKELEKIKK